MTEQEQFAQADAYEGNTMIVFSDEKIALRYALHRLESGLCDPGVMAKVDDTRTGSGLCVIWRDPVEPEKLAERLANCRWLLEEVLAGRRPRPVPGQVNELWKGGFPHAP